MIVVSDTSPVINHAIVGKLDLLRQLYSRVVIPCAVYDEVAVKGKGQPGASEVQSSGWIDVQAPADQAAVTVLELEVDPGEAEAIALAIELQADLLLMDERKGRVIAARVGLQTIGLLAVLIEAKRQGLLVAVKPILDDLIAKAGFWIRQELYHQVLLAAQE